MIIFRAEQSRAEQSRAAYIEILRIVACLLVIFNHTNERGFWRYVYDELGSFTWAKNLLVSIFCKSAVPLFFMISGSMLLSKQESLKKTFMRIPKILADLLIFSIAYFGTDAILAGNQFVLKDILQVILRSSYWHLWYLYAYISFIITLPFLRKFVISLDEINSLYMCVVAIILMGIIPILEYFFLLGINNNLKPNWLIVNVFIYPVIGYILDNKINLYKMKRNVVIGIWMINLICFLIDEVCEYYFLLREPGNMNEIFLTNFCLVNAVSIYSTVKYLFQKRKINRYLYNFIIEIGKCTFGIYLLHIWFLWKIPLFYNCWAKIESCKVFGSCGGIYVSCILTFMVSGVVTYLLCRIPRIKILF